MKEQKKLNVLFVGRQNNKLKDVMEDLSKYCKLTIVLLDPNEIKHIKQSLKKINYSNYDRVLFNLPFRRIKNKTKLIKTIPNLIIFDLDSWRNFRKGDTNYKQFLGFLHKLPHARLVCSGYDNTQKYLKEGVDTKFISKGCYNKSLKNLNRNRNIELGFIGRVNDKLYTERKSFLNELQQEFNIKLLRTYTPVEYLDTLNRIKIFISADIGYNEYMAKNFEAMTCGCLLVAKRQGKGEEEALGLIDMENIVLYNNLNDVKKKINYLLKNPIVLSEIATRGEHLAKSDFSYRQKAKELFEMLKTPTKEIKKERSFLSRIFYKSIENSK